MADKIKIHISFYIFLFFIIYFNGFSLFFSYFLALFIHEYMHYILSKKYYKMSQTINIYPFGMNVSVNINNKNTWLNFFIFLIGPLTNIFFIFIVSSIWWYFPTTYFYTKDFVFANFCLGFFNIIPIYPLDGGNMILSLFNSSNSKLKILKIMKLCAIVFSILFMILFVLSCFYSANFSCFCISIFLLSTIFSYKDVIYNDIKNRINNNDCIKEYRAYVIRLTTKFEEIEKCMDNNKFIHFYLLGENNKVIRVFSQEEILDIFNEDLEKINFNRELQS